MPSRYLGTHQHRGEVQTGFRPAVPHGRTCPAVRPQRNANFNVQVLGSKAAERRFARTISLAALVEQVLQVDTGAEVWIGYVPSVGIAKRFRLQHRRRVFVQHTQAARIVDLTIPDAAKLCQRLCKNTRGRVTCLNK
jgi:hypothetical protein